MHIDLPPTEACAHAAYFLKCFFSLCFILLIIICKYAPLSAPFLGLISAFYNYPKASCIVFSGAEMNGAPV